MFAAGKTDGAAAVAANYIEEVFSTYLYTGNGSTQTITNGIDLSGKGGLVWLKNRGLAQNHLLVDTARTNAFLNTNTTDAQTSNSGYSFASNGFSLTTLGNSNTYPFASWTFRKQPKFFDVVTYTGTGGSLTVNHNLGSTPGCIIVKRINSTSDWFVHHQDVNYDGSYLKLNSTAANNSGSVPPYFLISVTDTYFTMQATGVANVSGATYVAYLFAHNAGGFGLTGTDNVISCGSYTGNGSTSGPVVNLGYEPQWLLIKNASASPRAWFIYDNMRGMTNGSTDAALNPNSTDAEINTLDVLSPTATGFEIKTAAGAYNGSGETMIYIAIRRGPMKVPTDATAVFKPVARSGTGSTATITAGFPVDLEISKTRATTNTAAVFDRLRGATNWLGTANVNSEATASDSLTSFASNTGVTAGADVNGLINYSSDIYANWMFKRAPSFFDEVCYTGTGVNRTVSHNLAAVPELMIVRARQGNSWTVYASSLGNTKSILLESTAASFTQSTIWNNTTPTSSVFSVGTNSVVNDSVNPYVAYLFATCAGVSKVGSYTGNGSTQTIDCGFTGGARFVLIKRTDATGGWYVYDTARGMTVLTDPYLFLNSNAAETATLGSVTTVSTGFAVNASILAAINTNAANYIFLAIA